MDILEDLLVAPEIPEPLVNLQLPDPALVNYFNDVSRRSYYLEGEIDDTTLELIKLIFRYNAADKNITNPEERVPIRIFINSTGGDVQVMWSVVNAIRLSKTPVHTIAYCNAMSAAAHILASGHKRYAMPGTTILVHSGSCQFTGDVEKVESAKRYYDALSKRANDMLLSQTKLQAKDLKKKGASDWYMTEEDALENGIIDAIVSDIDTVCAIFNPEEGIR